MPGWQHGQSWREARDDTRRRAYFMIDSLSERLDNQ